jgi:hypothetical protein
VSKVVIWGLKSVRHSHRYIHSGFYDAFLRLGHETYWVDDSEESQKLLSPGSIVIAVNVASKYLVKVKQVKYVLHNLEPKSLGLDTDYLNLQVYTNNSTGETIETPVIKFDQRSKTLFQPWGIAIPSQNWLSSRETRSSSEFWIGAVWQNDLGQGNKEEIELYKKVLKSNGIQFRKRGGTRWITREGISENKALQLVNQSAVGAAIVGRWQLEHSYIPCRLFKNIAAGAIPASNSNMGELLGISGVFDSQIGSLVDQALGISHQRAIALNEEAKRGIHKFSYENSIMRILQTLG